MINFKPLFITSLLTASALSLCGCSSSNDDNGTSLVQEATITVNPESITAAPEGNESTISVTSTGDWSISANASWVTTFPTGGLKNNPTNVKVTIGANKDKADRAAIITVRSGKTEKNISVSQNASAYLITAANTLSFGAQEGSSTITVESNVTWTATSSEGWCTVSTTADALTVKCSANQSNADRKATVTLTADQLTQAITLTQLSDAIVTPEGYTLVWNDEFNTEDGSQPDMNKWYYDVWNPGFVNNELQRYVAGSQNGEKTAEINNGILNITAKKIGSEVCSARLNTRELWTYGYFEARLKLPKGKGTWPAFWMMPSDGGNWPHCGEIDIMEEVGSNANYTSSSIHCTAYNHTIGTQKTAERLTPGAEDEFHIYALEWTPDFIRTYVDGKLLFSFDNDKKGDDNTWPFHKPFHPILNLAWGGDWGGYRGIDESALPATYQIDYVRIFQKF